MNRFLPLARQLARRYAKSNEPLEDLEQVASLGLLKAIDRFDPTRATAFSSFAVPTILGELRRHFRDKGWALRVPRDLQELAVRVERVTDELETERGRAPTSEEIAQRIGVSIEQVLDAREASAAYRAVSLDHPRDDAETGDDLVDAIGVEDPGYHLADEAATVEPLMSVLSDRDREVLRLRFAEDLTQTEIGARVGVSPMHISRLIRQAVGQLREAARARRFGGVASTAPRESRWPPPSRPMQGGVSDGFRTRDRPDGSPASRSADRPAYRDPILGLALARQGLTGASHLPSLASGAAHAALILHAGARTPKAGRRPRVDSEPIEQGNRCKRLTGFAPCPRGHADADPLASEVVDQRNCVTLGRTACMRTACIVSATIALMSDLLPATSAPGRRPLGTEIDPGTQLGYKGREFPNLLTLMSAEQNAHTCGRFDRFGRRLTHA